MKISLIYITAREDYPMVGRPNVHQFTPLFDSLMEQNFDMGEFEVIICDVLYKDRVKRIGTGGIDSGKTFGFSKYPFKIKHVDPSEFSWSLKKNLPSYADNYNLGVIHADGELLLWFNDCSELIEKDSLQLWWDWYQKGYFAHALTVYFCRGHPLKANDASHINMYTSILHAQDMSKEEVKTICKYMEENGYWKDVIRDSRWKFLEDKEKKTGQGIYYCPGDQFYGYASSSLEAALKVNGYDSNFDGQKSLNDVEMGIRLQRIGSKFVCDRRLYIIEHVHVDYPSFMRSLHPSAWKNNYSLLLLNNRKNKITGNDYKLTKEELAWMVNHSKEFERLKIAPEEMEPELLKDWFENPPRYNLRELRDERIRKEKEIEEKTKKGV